MAKNFEKKLAPKDHPALQGGPFLRLSGVSKSQKRNKRDGVSIEELVISIISESIKISMEDRTWTRLGFKKRPKYGKIVNWFRKNWKVSLENKLLSELIILYLSYGVKSFSKNFSPKKLINEIKRQLNENYHGIKLWKTLNFESNQRYCEYLNEGIKSYYETNYLEWDAIIMQRISLKKIPDKQLRNQLMVGLIDLTSSLPNRKI